jgi:hypothetical protein
LGGNVVIYDNKSPKDNLFTRGSESVQSNVVLSENSHERIQTSDEGLGANAKVGVYVTGDKITDNPYKDCGSVHDNFGMHDVNSSTLNLDKFINDRNGLKGEKGEKCKATATDTYPNPHFCIRWASPLCKLTEKNENENSHLLFKVEDGMTRPAIYDSFTDALGSNGEKGELFDYNGNRYDESLSIRLEMLKHYTQKSDDRIQYLSERDITFTTAKSGENNDEIKKCGDDFVFINYSSSNNNTNNNDSMTAIITRGGEGSSGDRSMIRLENSNSTVTIEKLIFDGDNKEFNENGAIVDIGESNLILGDDTILKNGKTSGNGGAVYVASNGNLTLKSGGKIDNNTTSGNGGAVYIESNGTFTMQGGEINKNTVTGSGRGAGIFVSEGATLKLDGNVNFGGPGVNEDKEIVDTTGNFAKSILTGATNGGKEYRNGRQDIYIAGYESADVASLKVTGTITSGEGSIWVWPEKDLHINEEEQFAIFDGNAFENNNVTLSEEDQVSTMKAFRNARTDRDTSDGIRDDYLLGVAGIVAKNIY